MPARDVTTFFPRVTFALEGTDLLIQEEPHLCGNAELNCEVAVKCLPVIITRGSLYVMVEKISGLPHAHNELLLYYHSSRSFRILRFNGGLQPAQWPLSNIAWQQQLV